MYANNLIDWNNYKWRGANGSKSQNVWIHVQLQHTAMFSSLVFSIVYLFVYFPSVWLVALFPSCGDVNAIYVSQSSIQIQISAAAAVVFDDTGFMIALLLYLCSPVAAKWTRHYVIEQKCFKGERNTRISIHWQNKSLLFHFYVHLHWGNESLITHLIRLSPISMNVRLKIALR